MRTSLFSVLVLSVGFFLFGVMLPQQAQAVTGSCIDIQCPPGTYRHPLPGSNGLCECVAGERSEQAVDLGAFYTLRDGRPVSQVFNTPGSLLNLIVPNLFVIAGVAVMILTIVAGYKFIAQGQKGIEEAQKIAGAGILGLIIMFAAYWIVQIIKAITGADIPL